MSRNSPQNKHSRLSASKPIASQADQLSVTNHDSVTDKWLDLPRTCYRNLQPWLRLANLIPAAGATSSNNLDVERFYNLALEAFPEPRYPTGYKRALAKGFPNREAPRAVFFCETHFTNRKAQQLYSLAIAVRQTFEALIRGRQAYEAGEEYPAIASSPYAHEFLVLPDGRLCERLDLYNGKFLGALAQVKITRLMHCEVCRSLAYAVREGQRTCSKRCNAVRRVSAWRAKQKEYEYKRKLKGAGLKPGDGEK